MKLGDYDIIYSIQPAYSSANRLIVEVNISTTQRSRSPDVVETYVRLLIPTKLPLKV
jgi:hypothetical protein